MKFLHAMFKSQNIEKTFEFYRDFLGFEIIKKIDMGDRILYWLKNEESGDVILEIADYKDKTNFNNYDNQSFGHFAFGTKDITEVENKMKNFGYQWTIEPFFAEQVGLKIAFLKDNDGNEVEIVEQA